MKIRSNKIDPPKKKKESSSSVELSIKPGKEKSTYTPARALTGDTRYGKEDASKKDAKFIEEARAKKQDIAYKDGKPYRAGTTTTTKEKDQVSITIKNDRPKIKNVPLTSSKPAEKKVEKKQVKSSGKSSGKLKPMAMTYGTDHPTKGGGTMYKKKVRAIRGR